MLLNPSRCKWSQHLFKILWNSVINVGPWVTRAHLLKIYVKKMSSTFLDVTYLLCFRVQNRDLCYSLATGHTLHISTKRHQSNNSKRISNHSALNSGLVLCAQETFWTIQMILSRKVLSKGCPHSIGHRNQIWPKQVDPWRNESSCFTHYIESSLFPNLRWGYNYVVRSSGRGGLLATLPVGGLRWNFMKSSRRCEQVFHLNQNDKSIILKMNPPIISVQKVPSISWERAQQATNENHRLKKDIPQ